MLTVDKIFKLSFYKKLSPFYGSLDGIRYRIAKDPLTKASSKEEEAQAKLKLTCWPEPYSYEKTADELKHDYYFEFSEEGMEEAVKKINDIACGEVSLSSKD